MDVLIDALEDDHYIQELTRSSPMPTKRWSWLSDEQLQQEILHLTAHGGAALQQICNNTLGLHLFLKFVTRSGDENRSNFIANVAQYKNTIEAERCNKAADIIALFITKGSPGTESECPNLVGIQRGNQSIMAKLLSVSSTRQSWISPACNEEIQPEIPLLLKPVRRRTIPQIQSSATQLLSGSERRQSLSCFYTIGGDNAIQLQGNVINELLGNYLTGDFSINLFDDIEAILFHELKKKWQKDFYLSAEFQQYVQFYAIQKKPLQEADFFSLRTVGRGAFGEVIACRRATTGRLYALKYLSMRRIKAKHALASIRMERDLLIEIQSPFVVSCCYAFTTNTDAVLVLDLMMGGDLSFHLKHRGKFSEEESKYFAVRLALGIAALHDAKIVHRDLKPENVLMDNEGHTKLSDLGLASRMPEQGLTKTCGTRGYWAPEMLHKPARAYFYSVDWFSLGVCVFEFLTGISPFHQAAATLLSTEWHMNDKQHQDHAVNEAIRSMEPNYELIEQPAAKSFVKQLLLKNPLIRLGSNGIADIKQHPWLKDIAWDEIDYTTPPFCPKKAINAHAQRDIGEFDDAVKLKGIKMTNEDMEYFKEWNHFSVEVYHDEIVSLLINEEVKGPTRMDKDIGENCCNIC